MILTLDATELDNRTRQALHRVCTDDNAYKLAMAKIRQAKAAEFWHKNRSRSIDGVGAMELCIDPYFVTYFRQKYGTEITSDKDFRRWVKREDDVFRVRCDGTKIQVGYTGLSRGAKRSFSKKY